MFKFNSKGLCAAVIGLAALLPVSSSAADDKVNVIVNGTALSQPGVMLNGATLVPMRAIFEALGASVKWDGATRSVVANKAETEIKLTLGNPSAYVNGELKTLSAPAASINGATMVPLRFIGEALGAQVKWEGATKTANVTGEPAAADPLGLSKITVSPKTIVTGQTITVEFEGNADCRASFDIVGLQEGIPMSASAANPKKYTGTFTASKDMKVVSTIVKGHLKSKDGKTESTIECKDAVSVNSDVPKYLTDGADKYFKSLVPAPNEKLTAVSNKVTANFANEITRGAVRMIADKEDVTSSCTFADKSMTYTGEKNFKNGTHTVQIIGIDNEGQKIDYSWTFSCDYTYETALTQPADGEAVGDILRLVGTTAPEYKVDYEIQPQGNIGFITIKGNHLNGTVKADDNGAFNAEIDVSAIKSKASLVIKVQIYDTNGKKVSTLTRTASKS